MERMPYALPSALMPPVGDNAFTACRKLKTVTLPSGLKTIGTEAFRGDALLDNVTLPDGVTVINNGTFQGCVYPGISADSRITAAPAHPVPFPLRYLRRHRILAFHHFLGSYQVGIRAVCIKSILPYM